MMIWAQWTLIVLHVLSVGIHLGKNGEPREDKYSFGLSLFGNGLLLVLIYYAGGFKGML